MRAQGLDARTLWQKHPRDRGCETGEPYIDLLRPVNRAMPEHQKRAGPEGHDLEPLLARSRCRPGIDHLGNERTAVCCLSSLNLETWFEWNERRRSFIEDVMRFLDNVLQDFIDRAPPEMAARQVFAPCASARSASA